jgi:hypothetical protein
MWKPECVLTLPPPPPTTRPKSWVGYSCILLLETQDNICLCKRSNPTRGGRLYILYPSDTTGHAMHSNTAAATYYNVRDNSDLKSAIKMFQRETPAFIVLLENSPGPRYPGCGPADSPVWSMRNQDQGIRATVRLILRSGQCVKAGP